MKITEKQKGPERCCSISQGRKSGCAISTTQLQGCLWHISSKSQIINLFDSQTGLLKQEIARFTCKEVIMGGRGTYAAGKDVPYQYKTVGYIDGVKVLQPIDDNAARKLPEEAHSSQSYIKLDSDGKFSQYREYNEKHELVLEIAYHPEHNLTHDKENKPVLHAHDYDPQKHGKDWHQPARNLTVGEFEKYKKFFVKLSDAELKHQKERL